MRVIVQATPNASSLFEHIIEPTLANSFVFDFFLVARELHNYPVAALTLSNIADSRGLATGTARHDLQQSKEHAEVHFWVTKERDLTIRAVALSS